MRGGGSLGDEEGAALLTKGTIHASI